MHGACFRNGNKVWPFSRRCTRLLHVITHFFFYISSTLTATLSAHNVNTRPKECEQHLQKRNHTERKTKENQEFGFRPGPTQTGLYSHRRWIEAGKFEFRKQGNFTIRVAKTKALISFVVTAKLICVFVFAYANCREAQNKKTSFD